MNKENKSSWSIQSSRAKKRKDGLPVTIVSKTIFYGNKGKYILELLVSAKKTSSFSVGKNFVSFFCSKLNFFQFKGIVSEDYNQWNDFCFQSVKGKAVTGTGIQK